MSFGEIESISTILVKLFNPKSFLNSLILSIIDMEHGSGVILEPVGLPFACAGVILEPVGLPFACANNPCPVS
jgi:hypothetical protein